MFLRMEMFTPLMELLEKVEEVVFLDENTKCESFKRDFDC